MSGPQERLTPQSVYLMMKETNKNNNPTLSNQHDMNATIAATRFAMGLRPGDLELARKAPQSWLISQLKPISFTSISPKKSSAFSCIDVLKKSIQYRFSVEYFRRLEAKANLKTDPTFKKNLEENKDYETAKQNINELKPQKLLRLHTEQSMHLAMTTDQSFSWRLFDFFSNHFSVTSQGRKMSFLSPTLEREAIAPNILGSFEELLIAVASHPAMLVYLNNDISKGPNSRAVQKNKQRGLNENLAREILELHTLGINGGYVQNDVVELAKAISGWSVLNRKEIQRLIDIEEGKIKSLDLKSKDNELLNSSGFIFRSNSHEPGTRTVLNTKYSTSGYQQGIGILKDLAAHPKTIDHISRKIAQHFVSDKPSEMLVSHLKQAWTESKGNLKTIMEALVRHPDSWNHSQQKFKTPREFVISVGRATQQNDFLAPRAFNVLTQLGQKPFGAGSPAGYPDTKMAWIGSTALDAKIESIAQFSKRLNITAVDLAMASSGAQLSDKTRQTVLRAESQAQGRSLALLSPEFLHR